MATINVSLDSDLVDLLIDTAKNTVTITNQDTRNAVFNVFNSAILNGQPIGSVRVWSYTQPAETTSMIPIPTKDDSGGAINWVVGQITNKFGTSTGITNPPWQLTMV